ncbi:MAG: VIT and VWA domain-containing protein [Blastocatellia bacterium]|nr:VIT and VWA domain-containing protein [Blastocatellia bacterium]
MRRGVFSFFALSFLTWAILLAVQTQSGQASTVAAGPQIASGALLSTDGKGAVRPCPLKHTDVKAEISGFLSRVTVTQEFVNPFAEKIEAVYTFPLPHNAAVDRMTMRIGERVVQGKIKRREEAQAIYEAAKNAGQAAALLDQERPNIFTQAVANILPNEAVSIQISYVETLKYEAGTYEFVFPMVVGPRYNPGTPTGSSAQRKTPDTTQVPDASRIAPPVAAAGTRAGHDISLEITLDAGVPLTGIRSTTHEILSESASPRQATVRLRDLADIPNRDFILRYDVAGGKIEDAVLLHRGGQGGFFTMILQPPQVVRAPDVNPKELVFVLDTSGSMDGFPIEKAKECMKLALEGLYPQDTFNLITFAGDTHILFPQPVPATAANLAKAQEFLKSRSGGGGTEMMKAIRAALDPSDAQGHLRIVCFMTDGYVGNDLEIIGEIQKHPNARVFSFGIGSSVNRFLLEKMAEAGRGEAEFVSLTDDGSAAARRFHERVRNPLLTDISVDWSGLPVADVYPKRIPDLFSAKPVVIFGRYTGKGAGVARLRGKMFGREMTRDIQLGLPEREPQHDVLAKLWARARIDDLMNQDPGGAQQHAMKGNVQETITQMGLEYGLLTQFTSFVAVEELVITDGGTPRKVDVPVELPEGVSQKVLPGDENEETPVNGRQSLQLITLTPGLIGNGSGGNAQLSNTVTERQIQELPSTPHHSGQKRKVDPAKPASAGAVQPVTKSATDSKTVAINGQRASSTNVLLDGTDSNGPVNQPKDVTKTTTTKFHASVAAIVERLKKKVTTPTAEEASFVKNGKAEIQVRLADLTPETMDALKKLGFEVVAETKTAKLVVGRIAIEKLEALAELKAVRYIAPML